MIVPFNGPMFIASTSNFVALLLFIQCYRLLMFVHFNWSDKWFASTLNWMKPICGKFDQRPTPSPSVFFLYLFTEVDMNFNFHVNINKLQAAKEASNLYSLLFVSCWSAQSGESLNAKNSNRIKNCPFIKIVLKVFAVYFYYRGFFDFE